ncbi:hypothetical protein NE235_18705 [Actinoallomurus spadix]|uniref:Uncharacterized protein n=1 Tax=Actinoallomurus spadix TaxID=79912 RepID=A0ABP3FPZ0_9ACTN|nr:hypothetical protein [Actinoallomurus spadix]MCO5988136.1 hypothetical protein [Actinoallomurus spadix]
MTTPLRIQPLARLTWGTLLVTAPGAVLQMITGRPATASQRWVLRVLGGRHALQAGIDLARPTPTVLRLGAAVDLLHAATCAGAVAFLPLWRRPAAVDGTGALVLAAGALAHARTR